MKDLLPISKLLLFLFIVVSVVYIAALFLIMYVGRYDMIANGTIGYGFGAAALAGCAFMAEMSRD